MMIDAKYSLIASAVAALLLSACGGSPSNGVAVTSSAGKAVDGYIKGALVICDKDGNGAASTGEATTTTNDTGDFVFSPACDSKIVVTGGTNIDTGLPFKGKLLAPAGSKMATPLTTLVASGLSTAEVAKAFGLPTGTDVTTADPLNDPKLLKQTLAAQQILQQTSDTIGSLAQNTSPSAVQNIYAEVAAAIKSTVQSNANTPIVDTSGNVSGSLVTNVVKQSLTNVSNSTNTALSTVKTTAATISPNSLAELVAAPVAAQAQALATATDVGATATALQASPTIANAATQLSALLTKDKESSVDMTAAGAALQQLSDTDNTNNTAASQAITAAVSTQASAAGTNTTVDAGTLTAPSNYLAIQNDSLIINGNTYTLAAFGDSVNGVTLPSGPTSLDKMSFDYIVKGTPIPSNGSANTVRVSLGLEMSDVGSGSRLLQLILDQVDLTVTGGTTLSAVVPAGAKVYAYGRTTSGAVANLTLNNVSADSFVTVASNRLTFDAGKVLNKFNTEVAGLSSGSSVKTVFANLPNAKGTFNVKLSVSNINVQAQTSTTAVKGITVSVTNASVAPVAGLGVQGKVTVQ